MYQLPKWKVVSLLKILSVNFYRAMLRRARLCDSMSSVYSGTVIT